MDLRAQTSLLAAVLTVAIAMSVLLRSRKGRVHWLFVRFSGTVAVWYASYFFWSLNPTEWWTRLNLLCAILVPLSAERFFRAFATGETRRITIFSRSALAVGALLIATLFTPHYGSPNVRVAIFLFVLTLLFGSVLTLAAATRRADSRFERARLTFLAVTAALAVFFALADYLVYVGVAVPPIGSGLTVLFLFVLSQSIVRLRLLDLYELTGRMTVLLALSVVLASLFWMLTLLSSTGVFSRSLFAAMVVLLVYDPVRERMEEKVSQFFFRERYDLEQHVHNLRRHLAHVLELELLPELVLNELERTRRATHASLYLVAQDMRSYALMGAFGPSPPARIEFAAARPLLDRLRQDSLVVLERVERELAEQRDGRQQETVHEVLQSLEAMHSSVVIAIRSDDEIYGMLCLRDERLRDAFSPEELLVLNGLAAQIATAVQNSRLYERMKERDRLAVMGEMAASLAHEIRNPLGSIKASAQYLKEDAEPAARVSEQEFLDIIVEECDRLNRVVSAFLEYAHPSHGDPAPTDINAVVRRTVQVLGAEYEQVDWNKSLRLSPELPPVRIDPEHLRQVLINLLQNALQAIESRGQLEVTTRAHVSPHVEDDGQSWVEIEVSDSGPGIPGQVLATLFEPFVTTRTRGTGLGLAISRRLIQAAGGHIDVHSKENHGSTFTVRLPAAVAGSSDAGRSDSPVLTGGADTPSETGSNR